MTNTSATRNPKEIRTNCRACLASCGALVKIDERGERVLGVRGDKDHPRSKGYLCPKGPEMAWRHNRPDRLNFPEVDANRASWKVTLDDLADRIKLVIEQYGADGFGLYLGTGCDLLGANFTFRLGAALGTQQVYTPVTMDIAPSMRAAEFVTGYSGTLAPHWETDDEAVRLLIVFGSNPMVSHNHLSIGGMSNARQLWRSLQAREGKIWMIDPVETRSAKLADEHVVPIPGTDPVILAWLVREVLENHPENSPVLKKTRAGDRDRLRQALMGFDLDRVSQISGVETRRLQELLRDIREAGRIVVATGTGVRFGADGLVGEWLRWALLILTDSLEEPGGMWFDPGWQIRLDEKKDWSPVPETGATVSTPETRPDLPRYFGQTPCAALADEIEKGSLRAMIVFGGNPITAIPEPDRMTRAFQSLDALAVIDIVPSELTELSTHVLPATGMLERTDINGLLNRPYLASLSTPVVNPGAERWHSWYIICQLAERLGVLEKIAEDMDLDNVTEEEVFRKFVANARHSYEELRVAGSHGVAYDTRKRWALETAIPEGKWRLAPEALVARLPALLTDRDNGTFPLHLICGRQERRLNRFQNVENPKKDDHPLLVLSEADASRYGISEGALVRIRSAYGEVSAQATVQSNIRKGVVHLPMGWPEVNVTRLGTTVDVDPLTTQSQMTDFPVIIELARVPVD